MIFFRKRMSIKLTPPTTKVRKCQKITRPILPFAPTPILDVLVVYIKSIMMKRVCCPPKKDILSIVRSPKIVIGKRMMDDRLILISIQVRPKLLRRRTGNLELN
jgi:hypothetical protein